MLDTTTNAVILGLSENGLGVARSLAQKKIKIFGIDYCEQSGFYSKHVSKNIMPDPIKDEKFFIQQLMIFRSQFNHSPALFITADEYLRFYVNNTKLVDELFVHNLCNADLINSLQDKFSQYQLATKAGISVPNTLFYDGESDLDQIDQIKFPILVKGNDVERWRKVVGGFVKGFVVNDKNDLHKKLEFFKSRNVSVIIQEIIQSSDQQNYKVCVFSDKSGEIRLTFSARKIHQYPIKFGVGSCMVSIENRDLVNLGRKLFTNIGYRGVGSAEFKYDINDKNFKLIEINTRYWQQNTLADFCGMNFPLADYMEATGQLKKINNTFISGLKWVNMTLSFSSYRQYRNIGRFTFFDWLKDIHGEKRISFFLGDDMAPFFMHLIHYFKTNIVMLIQGKKKT